MDDLKILITARLNDGLSIKTINEQLKALSKHPSLQKLKIKAEIDERFIQSMNKFASAVEKIKKISDEQNRVVQSTTTEYRLLDGTVKKATEEILANGQVIKKEKIIHDQNKKAIQGEAEATRILADEIENLGKLSKITKYENPVTRDLQRTKQEYKDGARTIRLNTDNEGRVVGDIENIYNIEAEEKATRKLTQSKIELREQLVQLKREGRVSTKELEKLNTVIKTSRSIDELDNVKKKLKELQEISKRGNLIGQYDELRGNNVTEEQIKNILKLNEAYKEKEIREVSLNTVTGKWTATIRENAKENRILKGVIDQTTGSIYQQENAIKQASAKNLGFWQQLKVAAERVPVWMIAMTAFYGTLRGLRNAVNTIIEVDTQMTELMRVMDSDTNFDEMLERSIDLANELGRSITDVNEAVIGFARQGFDELESIALARSATLAQNISELTPDESVDALTAAMTIFNIEAEKSISIVDRLNEVDVIRLPTWQHVA